jgi:hypothetical protein
MVIKDDAITISTQGKGNAGIAESLFALELFSVICAITGT